MKIILYCQHVLGVGHFFRIMEIARALTGHEVILVTGGQPIPIKKLPAHVKEVSLPALVMDENFSTLIAGNNYQTIEEIKEQRRKRLMALIEAEKPDIFFVELYPFGRKAFRFELDPVLSYLREKNKNRTLVICSLRDILVEKDDTNKYETRVINTLNTYFDALLIHADPRLVKLDETFSRMNSISIPVEYTGFVTPEPVNGSRETLRRTLGISPDEFLILASAGGGQVGVPLMDAVTRAFPLVSRNIPLKLLCFTGPYYPQKEFEALAAIDDPLILARRFTSRFPDYLAAADLSISFAGYNTCMNILASGIQALVLPFAQNREQGMRAGKLAEMGALKILKTKDLETKRLAMIIADALKPWPPASVVVDLDGAANTATLLKQLHLSKEKGS